MPTDATTKIVAAVVSPVTNLSRACRMDGSDKADPWNDLSRNTGVISDMLDREFIREERVHGRTEADEEIGTQPGWPMLELALQPNQTAEDRGQHQSRDRDSYDGSHLVPKQVVDVLHRGHSKISWLNFIIGKR